MPSAFEQKIAKIESALKIAVPEELRDVWSAPSFSSANRTFYFSNSQNEVLFFEPLSDEKQVIEVSKNMLTESVIEQTPFTKVLVFAGSMEHSFYGLFFYGFVKEQNMGIFVYLDNGADPIPAKIASTLSELFEDKERLKGGFDNADDMHSWIGENYDTTTVSWKKRNWPYTIFPQVDPYTFLTQIDPEVLILPNAPYFIVEEGDKQRLLVLLRKNGIEDAEARLQGEHLQDALPALAKLVNETHSEKRYYFIYLHYDNQFALIRADDKQAALILTNGFLHQRYQEIPQSVLSHLSV